MEITWDKFKPRTTTQIRKLSLEKDEQARVVILGNPNAVYVHTFEKAVTDERGRAIKVTEKWPDGSPREPFETEYDGKFRCLGDIEELLRSGADAENCPACRASIEHPNAVRNPQPRYLVRVLKYAVKPGTFNPVKPFSAELIVWDLTERRMSQIYDIFSEHGDPTQKDLLLGPCENKGFQKYDIKIGGNQAQYLASKESLSYVKELLEDNPIDNIENVAGKKPSFEEMRIKASSITRAYQHAHGEGVGSTSYESLLDSGSADEDVDDTPPAKPATQKKSAPVQEEEPEEVNVPDLDDDEVDENDVAALEALLASLKE